MGKAKNLDGMGVQLTDEKPKNLCVYPDCQSIWIVSNTTDGSPGYCRAHAWVIFPTRYPKPKEAA